jgi:hypothetical protein
MSDAARDWEHMQMSKHRNGRIAKLGWQQVAHHCYRPTTQQWYQCLVLCPWTYHTTVMSVCGTVLLDLPHNSGVSLRYCVPDLPHSSGVSLRYCVPDLPHNSGVSLRYCVPDLPHNSGGPWWCYWIPRTPMTIRSQQLLEVKWVLCALVAFYFCTALNSPVAYTCPIKMLLLLSTLLLLLFISGKDSFGTLRHTLLRWSNQEWLDDHIM